MKIKKNLEVFRAFNQKVKSNLENHTLLKMLVGQELCDTAEEIVNNYFEHKFDVELNEKCFELVSDSVELSAYETYRLEEEGKLYDRTVAYYVLKEMMYSRLIRYIQARKAKVIEAPVLVISAAG